MRWALAGMLLAITSAAGGVLSASAGRPSLAAPAFGYPLRQAPKCDGGLICPGDRLPSWSPDGSRIAFLRFDRGRFHLTLMDANGRDVRRLPFSLGIPTQPQWSPDGTKLLLDCGAEGGLCSIDARTGTTNRIVADPDGAILGVPVWSPDGARIAFTVYGIAWQGPGWCCQLKVVDSDGRNEISVGGGPAAKDSFHTPAWSPDGRLAFLREDRSGGESSLWETDADGTDPRRILAGDPRRPLVGIFGWSSQGWIYVSTQASAGLDLERVREDGADVEPVAASTVGGPDSRLVGWLQDPQLTADGTGVSFTRFHPDGTVGVNAIVARTERPLAVGVSPQARPYLTSLSWSPEGTRLAYTSDGDCPTVIGIHVVRVPSGTHGRLTEPCAVRGTRRADRLTGTKDTDAIYGRAGADSIHAGSGPDFVQGGPGGDFISGGPGDDRLYGGPGRDVIQGGRDWDAIVSRDRSRDRVACGPGKDVVWADRFDLVATDCELVERG